MKLLVGDTMGILSTLQYEVDVPRSWQERGGLEAYFQWCCRAAVEKGVTGMLVYDPGEGKMEHLVEGTKKDCLTVWKEGDPIPLSLSPHQSMHQLIN